MFGTVLADRGHLSESALARYKACYCGLCRTLKTQYGTVSRLTLSYDLTFLAVLLQSLYEPEESCSCGRCLMHPKKKREFCRSVCTEYAAAMNVALTYHKCMDDWRDERKLSSRLLALGLKPAIRKIQKQYPEKCRTMEACLKELSALEMANSSDADSTAACFGRLTGELFVYDESDRWADALRRMGDALGRFIYLSDALLDLEDDLKKGRYNPLKEHASAENKDAFLPILHGIMADCMAEFDRLPLVQDTEILKNVLYSGIWIPYYSKQKKKEG